MRAMALAVLLAACGGATAAPSTDGGACVEAYQACHALADCCPDAICSHSTQAVGVCSPFCTHNADCETGCCVTVGGQDSTTWACVEASSCACSGPDCANEQHP